MPPGDKGERVKLGRGWLQCTDKKGRTYYVHKKRKVSQWTLPDELKEEGAQPCVSGGGWPPCAACASPSRNCRTEPAPDAAASPAGTETPRR